MVFAAARLAGWADDVACASSTSRSARSSGRDKKMLKTRAGDSVRLADLLDEAIERAAAVVEEKSPQLDPETQRAHRRARSASARSSTPTSRSDRIKDYVFDWDRMLALDGNTAPYLMYAHARIRSILRKGGTSEREAPRGAIRIDEPAERALALELLGFPATVERTADTLQPHRLCGASTTSRRRSRRSTSAARC